MELTTVSKNVGPTELAATELAERAVLSLNSPASRRNYAREIRLFIESGRPINREGVLAHLLSLEAAGKGPVTRNVALAAIRLLAREANIYGILDELTLAGITRIKTVPLRGKRLGNWLDVAAVRKLLETANNKPKLGTRDAALLATMIGCAMRRSEAVGVTWAQLVERENRWVWRDVQGKGNRVRTIPVPVWVHRYLTCWAVELEREHGAGYRTIEARPFPIGVDSAYLVVTTTAQRAGLDNIAPHDLRRTSARLMRKGGADLEQISLMLGHANVQTTQKYLNTMLELEAGRAAADKIMID